MNPDQVQNLRYKLQKRVRRLNSARWESFHFALKTFWAFLQSQPTIVGILEELERAAPASAQEDVQKTLAGHPQAGETELEEAALAYFMLKDCVASTKPLYEVSVGHRYRTGEKHDGAADGFRDAFVEPLYEYIDERLDDQRAVLSVLTRYKHRCEWFRSQSLHDLWKLESERGELLLARDLYEYLHDQGLDIHIEPKAATGRPDMVSMQSTEDPLVADVKVFDPDGSRGRDYLVKGFNQVYTYTCTLNQPFGYLVVFKLCERDLRFLLKAPGRTPLVIHNNKTIFIIVIDIAPYEAPPSKRGALKPIEVTEDELVGVPTIDAGAAPPPAAGSGAGASQAEA